MTEQIVLDASAVLALLHREPGSSVVIEHIRQGTAAISAVNVAEVIAKQRDLGIPATEASSMLRLLGVQTHVFDQAEAEQTGHLRKQTKHLGLSLGDRACLSLGKRLNCPVLTADRSWSRAEIGVEIVLIR